MLAADQRRTQAGKLSFTQFRKTLEKGVGYQEADDGISQKFKLFIIFRSRLRRAAVG